MKLSTAILKGSKNRSQGTGELEDYDGAVCALGAACYGVGIKPGLGADFSNDLQSVFPELGVLTEECLEHPKTLADKIVKHNDSDGWSFKRIATWLRKLGY